MLLTSTDESEDIDILKNASRARAIKLCDVGTIRLIGSYKGPMANWSNLIGTVNVGTVLWACVQFIIRPKSGQQCTLPDPA